MRTLLRAATGFALFVASLSLLTMAACLSGNKPDVSDYCEAYKQCLCRDTFGKENEGCVKAANARISARPSSKTGETHCQDLFEGSACYLPFPIASGSTIRFNGGASTKFVNPGSAWVRGDCARAIACCVQIKTTSDREKCIEEVEAGGSESACRKVAGKYSLNLGSCNPATPGTKGAVIPPRPEPPKPEPKPEPQPEPTNPDGGNIDGSNP